MFTRVQSLVLSAATLSALSFSFTHSASTEGQPRGTPVAGFPYDVDVTPDNDTTPQREPGVPNYTATFTVKNTGTETDIYLLTCWGEPNVTCVSLDVYNVTLDPNQTRVVTATYSTGGEGLAQLSMSAEGGGSSSDVGQWTVQVGDPAPPSGGPRVSLAPYNPDLQTYARCAYGCFAVRYKQSTTPYFSLDVPRGVTLAYNGDRVDSTAFVHVDVVPDTAYGQTPLEYRLKIKVNGAFVRFVNGEDTLRFAYGGLAARRLGGQFWVPTYVTGAYPMDVLVTAVYSGAAITTLRTSRLVIENERSSPVARGWTLAGIQRLYVQANGAALITEGDGSWVYFRKPTSVFLAPPGEFSQLVSGTPGGGSGWTRRYPDSTKVVFNSAGRMIEIRDRFNNISAVLYDGSGFVVKIKDPLNLGDTLAYNANGLSTITGPGTPARVTTVTVDVSKRLTAVRDPDLVSTTFGYDAALRLSSVTNRRGHTTSFGFDAQSGKLTAFTAPAVVLVDGSTASPVDSLFAWQRVGVPYGSTGTPFSAPLVDSVVARVKDALGHESRFTVNAWGAPARQTDALGRTTTVTYDANGLPVVTVYPTGAVDSASYHSNGQPIWTRAAGSSRTNFTYAGWAQVDSMWGDGQVAIRRGIGLNGCVDWERVGGTTGFTAKTQYTYDTRGRVLTATDPEGHVVLRSWYQGQNENRSRDETPGGRITTYGYDTYGRRTMVTPPGGLATTTSYYSIINRVDSVRVGTSGQVTRYGHDQMFLTTVTDQQGQVYGTSYNALGWVTTNTDPMGARDSLWYDRDGALRCWKNRRGQVIDYAYDVLHRRLSRSGPPGADATWSYSADGRVVTDSNTTARQVAYYRANGWLDSTRTTLLDVPSQVYAVRYTYTAAGLVDSVIPSGPIPFTKRRLQYNTARGILSQIRLGGLTTTLTKNSDNVTTTVTLPGADQVSQTIMATHQSAQTTTGAAYAEAVRRFFRLDLAGRTQHYVYGTGTESQRYTYDNRGRVTSDTTYLFDLEPDPCTPQSPWEDGFGVTCTLDPEWYPSLDETNVFVYDSIGNRTDRGGAYTTGNRITSFDGCSYQTDLDGNVTRRECAGAPLVTLTWTAESWLTNITVGTDTIRFHYDASGRLARKDRNGVVERRFLWTGPSLLAELDAAGTAKIAEYSYYPGGLDRLHAVILGTTAYFAHTDRLGNMIALTDSAKNVYRAYQYDPWGNHLAFQCCGDTTSHRPRWKGALWMGSEVGLYYMRARWYEPRTGRFLSEDPLGLGGGINQYVFGGDDPINRGDPTGRDWCEPNFWYDVWECVGGEGFYDCQMADDPNACPGLTGAGEPPRGGLAAARARSNLGPWGSFGFQTGGIREFRTCPATPSQGGLTARGVAFSDVTITHAGITYLTTGTGDITVWRGKYEGYRAVDARHPRSGTYYRYTALVSITFDTPVPGLSGLTGYTGLPGRIHCESGIVTGGGPVVLR